MVRKIILLFSLIPLVSFAQTHNKIDVLVLGTFHFGDTPDFRGAGFDDLLKPSRQREIRQVVRKLGTFRPDKIFVENTPEAQPFWDRVYKGYLKGITPLKPEIIKNEIFQLGIRTAALTKNKNGVICINYVNNDTSLKIAGNSALKEWNDFANAVTIRKPDYDAFFKSNSLASGTFNSFMRKHEDWKILPLKEHLVQMNEEESLRELHYFNVLAWMDNNANGIGAELSSLEYFRNLKIVQNLYSKLENSDKRILIIFGAAHTQILLDILRSHPVFNVVTAKSVLR